ncbi:Ger(x)C family spore germination protein [Cohnella ginsengisoli]|uniref:Ger(X)C family spore germination protein n=1 Tax=Cohnella ginsengisoli TaxID=425004 RepID=A0A9X4QM53_9BACL|nr:Ger(x)C family spore germination protein [Cohnella ginsengisoli]MDG0790971.1 Ger(x)C family spore germination protein [Cohnella ginsengisoli]
MIDNALRPLKRASRLASRLCPTLLAAALLCGCWDRTEIEDRAIVLGISIDKASPEAESEEEPVSHYVKGLGPPASDLIRVGVQLALPGRIPLGPGETGGGGGGNDPQKTVWVLDVVGHSVNDALMNLQQELSAKLFFGHLRVIVISEEMARFGLENVNDYFHRNSEVRRMAWMMVAKGEALALMKASPKLERVPSLYLMTTLDEGIRMGKFPQDYIGIFWSRKSKLGQEGFLPYVELRKNQTLQIQGLALFQGSRMVGATMPLDIAVYMALKGNNPGGYSAFVKVKGTEVMTHVTHREAKTTFEIRDGKPYFKFNTAFELNLEEKINNELNIQDPSVIRDIEESQSKGAVKLITSFLEKTQALGSDVLGLGEYVRAKAPDYWNRNVRTKERWQRMYKEIEYEIHIEMKIRRIGMKAE